MRRLLTLLGKVSPGWRLILWALYAVAWTTALLVPLPIKPATAASIEQVYWFGKALHVSAYVVMTGLTGWLPVPRGRRWLLLLFLSAHACLTEYLQWLLDIGRTGCWSDVGLDHLGIALGLVVTGKLWLRP